MIWIGHSVRFISWRGALIQSIRVNSVVPEDLVRDIGSFWPARQTPVIKCLLHECFC